MRFQSLLLIVVLLSALGEAAHATRTRRPRNAEPARAEYAPAVERVVVKPAAAGGGARMPSAWADSGEGSGPQTRVLARVVVGNKVSMFRLVQSQDGSTIAFRNSVGQNAKRGLSGGSFKNVLLEYDKLPMGGKPSPACRRSKMSVTKIEADGRRTTRSGCLLNQTPTSKAYSRFATMLVMAF